MSFFIKKKQASAGFKTAGLSKKKKIKRTILIFCLLILVTVISYVAFLIASGSKAFQNGFSGQSLLNSLYGGEKLKGADGDRVNLLLMGMGGANHPGGLLTDSIMVVSIRPSDKKIAILSVPRDLQVSIPGHGNDKINTAYSDGYNDYYAKQCNKKNATACKDSALIEGAKLSVETISKALDIPLHYYATIDFAGFEKIIDQLGGVDVNVEKSIDDPLFPADDMVHYSRFRIKAGNQHLDGKTALKFARSRETTNDFDRARRQQQVMSAAKDKAMTVGFLSNPKKVADVVSTLGSSVRISFSPGEMKSFAELLSGVSMGNAVTEVLSNGPDGLLVDYNDGVYYLKPKTGNFKEIQNLARNIFDYKKKESAKIEVQNGSKTSGLGGILAKNLQDDGYIISAISTANQKTSKTIIYDLTGGTKKVTAEFLRSKLNTSLVETERKNGELADFKIIIGDDYKPSN